MKKKETSHLTVDQYLDLPYTIELTPDEGVTWFAEVRELPGCMSDGDSPNAAISNLREAMRGWIAAALEDVGEIPLPRSTEDYGGKFLVRTSPSLHRRLAELAEEEGVSTNQLCVALLTDGVTRSDSSMRREWERVASGLDKLTQRIDAFTRSAAGWNLETPQGENVVLMPIANGDVHWDLWSGGVERAKA